MARDKHELSQCVWNLDTFQQFDFLNHFYMTYDLGKFFFLKQENKVKYS